MLTLLHMLLHNFTVELQLAQKVQHAPLEAKHLAQDERLLSMSVVRGVCVCAIWCKNMDTTSARAR